MQKWVINRAFYARESGHFTIVRKVIMGKYSFSIGSCMLENGNRKVLKPNKDGVYEGLCMMVLGNQPSQNGKIYEPQSMMDAITNPDGCCCKMLRAGGFAGEWGHPLIYNESELSRIATIDMTRVSHVIVKLYTGETTEKGNTPVYGDVKPFGPYGEYLQESLESPVLNTAFSLRSLVEKTGTSPEGYIIQRVMALVSFDAVSTSGYRAASKVAPASAVEGYEIPVNPSKSQQVLKEMVSQEVISDHQLEDMLGLDKIKIMHHSYDITSKNLMSDGKPVDIFHTLFKG